MKEIQRNKGQVFGIKLQSGDGKKGAIEDNTRKIHIYVSQFHTQEYKDLEFRKRREIKQMKEATINNQVEFQGETYDLARGKFILTNNLDIKFKNNAH